MTPPTLALTGPRLAALELLLGGLAGAIDGYCLPGERPPEWPNESILLMPRDLAERASAAGTLMLTDPDGTPLAALKVTAIGESARAGTAVDQFAVAGTLGGLQPAEHPPARDIRFTRRDQSAAVIAVFSMNPLAHQVARAIEAANGRPLLLVAVSWNALSTDYRVSSVVDELRRCAAEIPLAEARFLAIAELSPGMSAHEVLLLALDQPASGGGASRTVLDFSAGDSPGAPTSAPQGLVVLLTGLSGSGKSTVARALAERLSSDGLRPVLLDGDEVRRALSPTLGFSIAERLENVRRIGWVAAQIASAGGIAICAPIAPFAEARLELRRQTEPASRFALVYVSTPIEVCEARDRKGLYALARAGTLTDFTGVDSPYEVPTDADVVVDTSLLDLRDCVEKILTVVRQN